MRIAQSLRDHFAAYQLRSKGDFLWRVTLEGLAVSLGVILLLGLAFELPDRTDLKGVTFTQLVCLAPLLETLLLQSLPVMVARAMGLGFRGQLLAAWIPFAALHFSAGVDTGICAGIVSGFYIAFTYTHWRQDSVGSAYWMTTGTHALHNLALVMLIRLGSD